MLKFVKIREDHLELILNWRVKPEVTRYMFTDVEYNMSSQRKWFQSISKDKSSKYWLISYQDKLIGLINLTDIDKKDKHCKWGYYIGEQEYRSLGGLISPYLYNYVFLQMKFKKIIAEVTAGNDNVIGLHQLHGYQYVGIFKDDIFKNGKYHDVHVFELLADTWLSLQSRYGKCTAVFEE